MNSAKSNQANTADRAASAARRSGVVTLLTDFGNRDGYVAAMKGVILSRFSQAVCVDLSHEITPQDITAAAFLLQHHFRFFPAGTVHVAVVDPGVGTERRAIACRFDGHFFVAPDNGLLDFCLHDKNLEVVELANPAYWRDEVSNTFHGRDLFAPAGAHLAAGIELGKLGAPTRLIKQQSIASPTVQEKRIAGAVIYIDRFGNLITNISAEQYRAKCGDLPCQIKLRNLKLDGISQSYGHVGEGDFVALINSFDLLEIGVRNGSARDNLGCGVGEHVMVEIGK